MLIFPSNAKEASTRVCILVKTPENIYTRAVFSPVVQTAHWCSVCINPLHFTGISISLLLPFSTFYLFSGVSMSFLKMHENIHKGIVLLCISMRVSVCVRALTLRDVFIGVRACLCVCFMEEGELEIAGHTQQ